MIDRKELSHGQRFAMVMEKANRVLDERAKRRPVAPLPLSSEAKAEKRAKAKAVRLARKKSRA